MIRINKSIPHTPRPRFLLGAVCGTPRALAAIECAGEGIADLLQRHQSGDWGEICTEDAQLNEQAIHEGSRIMSAYRLRNGMIVWCITEADRCGTTFLLPDEY